MKTALGIPIENISCVIQFQILISNRSFFNPRLMDFEIFLMVISYSFFTVTIID